jgi:PAS domain S-box-containing protein
LTGGLAHSILKGPQTAESENSGIVPHNTKTEGSFTGEQSQMSDDTREDLLSELLMLRGRVAELEAREPSPGTFEKTAVLQALRESEEKYRTVVQKSHEAILIAQDGMHRFVNPAAARIWGHSEEELLSRPLIEFLHPDDREIVLDRSLRRARGEKLPSHYAHRVLTKDGETRWVEIDSAAISWEGKPAVLVFAIDVTERKQMEEAIKERDEHYRALVEESFDGILIIKETKVIFVNSRLCQMMGYSKEELEGMDHWLTVHPDHRDVVRERSLARMRGESVPPSYQVKKQRKDGSVFDAEIHARAIEIQGAPGVQVWIRDISESKRAETALRESEERFRTAFQTSPDPAAISRLSDGVFIEANDGFTELSGFTREEVIGKSSLEINMWHDPGDRDRLVAGLNERGYVKNLEARFRQKDGSVRSGLMSARIIFIGGEPHILSVTRDVEEWKRAEQALRESEERYRTLFEESIDAVYITTREGVLVDANQAFLDLFGFRREEARSMEIVQIYTDAADRKRFQEEIERIGSVGDYEVRFRKKDGTRIEGLLSATVRRDKDGTILGYQGIVRDVTEQRKLQSQLLQAQKMEAVGTMAGGIAHDFNNLLQAILGYSDLLLMKKQPGDPDRKRLEVIQHAARDGADLVSRILMFSRKVESKVRPIDLNEEIRRVEKLLRRTLPRMIQIDLVLGEDLRIIDADPAQIEQVLLNLAVNAQHAMPNGGQILIETKNLSLSDAYLRKHLGARPGDYVLVTVSDTGVGMETELLDRIFEPFFTTKTNAGGTGLGLSIVHGIVSQHGGYIRCYSEPGKGTSFKIYFPVSASELIPDLTMTREMPAFGTETILVVDDDDRVREMGRQMIEIGGYKVLCASSGEEALEMYTSHRGEISLIILDLIMPGMGGSRCLEELIRIDPDVAVLVASGYSENGLRVREQLAGARGFIRKPYDAIDILIAIRKVLDEGNL